MVIQVGAACAPLVSEVRAIIAAQMADAIRNRGCVGRPFSEIRVALLAEGFGPTSIGELAEDAAKIASGTA